MDIQVHVGRRFPLGDASSDSRDARGRSSVWILLQSVQNAQRYDTKTSRFTRLFFLSTSIKNRGEHARIHRLKVSEHTVTLTDADFGLSPPVQVQEDGTGPDRTGRRGSLLDRSDGLITPGLKKAETCEPRAVRTPRHRAGRLNRERRTRHAVQTTPRKTLRRFLCFFYPPKRVFV